jgi:hypothetical protein
MGNDVDSWRSSVSERILVIVELEREPGRRYDQELY